MITPLDIENKKFSKQMMNGYSVEEVDDFLDDLTPSKENNKMICDIYEEDGKYFIEVDVPGFKKEDIKIECDKGNLKIVAEKHSNKEEHNKKKYIHRERKFYEKCERSFYLWEGYGDKRSPHSKPTRRNTDLR